MTLFQSISAHHSHDDKMVYKKIAFESIFECWSITWQAKQTRLRPMLFTREIVTFCHQRTISSYNFETMTNVFTFQRKLIFWIKFWFFASFYFEFFWLMVLINRVITKKGRCWFVTCAWFIFVCFFAFLVFTWLAVLSCNFFTTDRIPVLLDFYFVYVRFLFSFYNSYD